MTRAEEERVLCGLTLSTGHSLLGNENRLSIYPRPFETCHKVGSCNRMGDVAVTVSLPVSAVRSPPGRGPQEPGVGRWPWPRCASTDQEFSGVSVRRRALEAGSGREVYSKSLWGFWSQAVTSRVTPGGRGQCSVTLGGGGNRSRSWGEATLAAVLTTTARTERRREGGAAGLTRVGWAPGPCFTHHKRNGMV